jgi:hypothetical protein
MAKVKISELPVLSSGSLSTILVGDDNGVTYQIPLSVITASVVQLLSASTDTRLDFLEEFQSDFYVISASIDTKIAAATNEQSLAHLTTTASFNTFTQSYSTDSASFNSRIISGSAVAGTISGSAQISALGFVTGAYTTINEFNNLTQSFNTISQSFTTISGSFGDIDFSGINAVTESYLLFTQSYYSASASVDTRITNEKNRIDAILSASNANSDTFAEVVSLINSVDLTNDNAFATFYTASNGRLTSLENATSSYLTSLDGALSSSAQVLNGSGIFSSSAQLPNGLISSSLGFVATSSYSTDSASFNSRIISGSAVAGTISSSAQISAFGYITSSQNVDTSSFVQSSQTSSMSVKYATTASYAENIQISGSITNVKSITFDRTAGVSVVEGQMAWNNSDGTLDIGLNFGDVVLQVGQEQHFVVRNATGTTISNGTAVYASGLSVGSKRIEVSPFTANGTTDEVRFLGLATHNISDGVNGVVSNFGYVRGLDTRGTSVTAISVGDETWAEGDILYAHPTAAGKLTKVAPKEKITVAMVTTRHQTTGVLFVRPSSFGHIDDLHDVQINTGSLVTGSMLEWNGDYFVNNNTFSSSVDSRIKSGSAVAGTISSSAQISGLGFVSSSNLASIQTITSASYAALTPVSGTLYIIIG